MCNLQGLVFGLPYKRMGISRDKWPSRGWSGRCRDRELSNLSHNFLSKCADRYDGVALRRAASELDLRGATILKVYVGGTWVS
jgi:hypothetical protein